MVDGGRVKNKAAVSLKLPVGWRCVTSVHTQLPWKAERGVFWQSDTRVILDLSNFQVDPCHRGCPDHANCHIVASSWLFWVGSFNNIWMGVK